MSDQKSSLRIVKLGGSVCRQPGLLSKIECLSELSDSQLVLVVCGGGEFAEAVRRYDRIHELSDQHNHELAIQAMVLMSKMIQGLTDWPTVNAADLLTSFDGDFRSRLSFGSPTIVECTDWLNSAKCTLPASWSVTSDSIAAALAIELNASLTLVKSTNRPSEISWGECSKQGLVDEHFPKLAYGIEKIDWLVL